MNRTGPTPLALHLSLAAMSAGGDDARLESYMAGVRKYQLSSYQRDLTPLPEIWRLGTVTLSRIQGAAAPELPPLLVIPSMINRSYILDLMSGFSCVRWLAGQGRDVILLDWGNSPQDPGQATLDQVVMERLIPAIAYVHEQYQTPVDMMGYCMGGTLLVSAACHAPEVMRRLVFLATPWDFDAGDRALQAQVLAWAISGQSLMATTGVLPASWAQTVFACVDPAQVLNKFSAFADKPDEDPDIARFVAVEDWLNDAADLPAGVARACIHDWYTHNQTQHQKWRLGGKVILPQHISHETLVVSAQNDRLVPPQSSQSLARSLLRFQELSVATGHIGLLAGRKAVAQVWKPISDFLQTES
ncbi:MAG: alpha/beta fold hydrolase [Alphaproteobacteria bacterium]|nr:alpha/beta fold hydrolase [Alphaproteobacteria bacterium]